MHVVYVHGGCSNLVGCPLCEKLEWLKNLSSYEGMLRLFNSSMVMYLTMPTFIHLMLCMFMGGALTLLNVSLGENRVVKGFKHF